MRTTSASNAPIKHNWELQDVLGYSFIVRVREELSVDAKQATLSARHATTLTNFVTVCLNAQYTHLHCITRHHGL